MKKTNKKATQYKFDGKRNWYFLDAKSDNLGRLGVKISLLLQGKRKPCFAPQLDCGDFVIVVNTRLLKVSHPAKWEGKNYFTYTGYAGGIRRKNLKEAVIQNPNDVMRKAVFNMLPKNNLRRPRINRLKLFTEEKEGRELYEAMRKKTGK
ncbi:MAG: 50S ribosomal protein L13 [Candidatus Moranbacteria bacterium]|nr:50S ribosomal protein L13 [Candidatus Moranbacteria bacterium]